MAVQVDIAEVDAGRKVWSVVVVDVVVVVVAVAVVVGSGRLPDVWCTD